MNLGSQVNDEQQDGDPLRYGEPHLKSVLFYVPIFSLWQPSSGRTFKNAELLVRQRYATYVVHWPQRMPVVYHIKEPRHDFFWYPAQTANLFVTCTRKHVLVKGISYIRDLPKIVPHLEGRKPQARPPRCW